MQPMRLSILTLPASVSSLTHPGRHGRRSTLRINIVAIDSRIFSDPRW